MALIYDISKPFPHTLEFNDRKLEITLYYDRVISFFALFEDKNSGLCDTEKLEIGFSWLFKQPFGRVSSVEKLGAMQILLDRYINFRKTDETDSENVLSFTQDSLYIYGSFMAAYGMDLFAEQGRLHWWKFIALFEGLPDESKIKQVMSIRAREIPKPDGHNQKLIKQIVEQKRYYALEVPQDELKKRADSALKKLFDILSAKAGD